LLKRASGLTPEYDAALSGTRLGVYEVIETVSPDGKWAAYTQGAAGQSQVMLRGFPETSGRSQVSAAGGTLPVWSPAGDKLYFPDVPGPAQMFVVDVKTTPEVSLSMDRSPSSRRGTGVVVKLIKRLTQEYEYIGSYPQGYSTGGDHGSHRTRHAAWEIRRLLHWAE
jgi:WD40-like Beta Propeller Repeat